MLIRSRDRIETHQVATKPRSPIIVNKVETRAGASRDAAAMGGATNIIAAPEARGAVARNNNS